jgi:hypothetical protein
MKYIGIPIALVSDLFKYMMIIHGDLKRIIMDKMMFEADNKNKKQDMHYLSAMVIWSF